MESATDFKNRLIQQAGLTRKIVDAAWPDWWSDEADSSDSARTELRLSMARKLGLDPRTLLNDVTPRWIWQDSARFKNFRGDVQGHQPAISSFGMALGRILLDATELPNGLNLPAASSTAAGLRQMLLRSCETVGLLELLQLAWLIGIPVIHLRVYPLSAKQMSAMSVCMGERFVIFLARDGQYPPASTFHLAHEIGHILLGHLKSGQSIVDLGGLGDTDEEFDCEEMAADAFAMELLTGQAELTFDIQGEGRAARQLAREALRLEREDRIEAGVLALTYGHFTKNWDTATASLPHIYSQPHAVWDAINLIAGRNIRWSRLADESESYLRAVMGGVDV